MTAERLFWIWIRAGCYIEPTVLSTDENLAKQRDEGNKLLTVTVTISFSDRQEVINGDVMKDWLTTDEEGNVDLDRDKGTGVCAAAPVQV